MEIKKTINQVSKPIAPSPEPLKRFLAKDVEIWMNKQDGIYLAYSSFHVDTIDQKYIHGTFTPTGERKRKISSINLTFVYSLSYPDPEQVFKNRFSSKDTEIEEEEEENEEDIEVEE